MGRVYSFTGCVACRQRKKQCDEGKPSCAACVRLGLACQYGVPTPSRKEKRGVVSLGVINLPTGPSPSRALTTVSLKSSAEAYVLQSTPDRVVAFFSPVCGMAAKDLQVLWQMMFQDGPLRNAVVACFSHIVGASGDFQKMNRDAYGRALRLVQAGVLNSNLSKAESIGIQASIMFLGLLDSAGSEIDQDPLNHWKGMAILIAHSKEMGSWPDLPRSVYMLILEATVFHISCHAMFSRELLEVYKIWKRAGIIDLLERLNPPGSGRLAHSPVISGQYTVYDYVLEVTFLHRQGELSSTTMQHVREMEAFIRHHSAKLESEFRVVMAWGCSDTYYAAICQVFHIFCNSLLICILALQQATTDRSREIDMLALENIERFAKLPLIPMTYGTAIWGIQITACAIRHGRDFKTVTDQWEKFKPYVDPGHSSRADKLISRLQGLRDSMSGPRNAESSSSLQPFSSRTGEVSSLENYALDTDVAFLNEPHDILSSVNIPCDDFREDAGIAATHISNAHEIIIEMPSRPKSTQPLPVIRDDEALRIDSQVGEPPHMSSSVVLGPSRADDPATETIAPFFLDNDDLDSEDAPVSLGTGSGSCAYPVGLLLLKDAGGLLGLQ